jgi:MmyB-like transcription regulator ligand binding domain
VLALPGVPAAWRRPDFTATPLPLLPVEFAKDGTELSYFSLVTTVGTPQDITLQELRIEAFFPADEATTAHRWTA